MTFSTVDTPGATTIVGGERMPRRCSERTPPQIILFVSAELRRSQVKVRCIKPASCVYFIHKITPSIYFRKSGPSINARELGPDKDGTRDSGRAPTLFMSRALFENSTPPNPFAPKGIRVCGDERRAIGANRTFQEKRSSYFMKWTPQWEGLLRN